MLILLQAPRVAAVGGARHRRGDRAGDRVPAQHPAIAARPGVPAGSRRRIERLVDFIRHLPSSRAIGLTVLGIIVVLIVVRLVLAALARDETGTRARRARAARVPARIPSSRRIGSRPRAASRTPRTRLYRGVLLALARSDRVRLDPSKTSGDYARELRARGSASYQPFRAFSRRFDVAVFGHGGCDAALIDDLRRLAAPFAPRARAA